jgi:hypothetical protein
MGQDESTNGLAWIAPLALFIVALVMLAGGVWGIYYQGEFWGNAAGGDGWTAHQGSLASGWPMAVTITGALLMSWAIWLSRARVTLKHILHGALLTILILACLVASRLAGTDAQRYATEPKRQKGGELLECQRASRTPTRSSEVRAGTVPAPVRAFRDAVHSRVIPASLDIDPQDEHVGEKILVLARKHLLPNKDVLHEDAKRRLRELPTCDPEKIAQMEDLLTEERKKELRVVSALFRLPFQSPDGFVGARPDKPALCLAANMWDPVLMAQRCRSTAVTRILGVGALGKIRVIEALVPPTVAALDRDPERPKLVVLFGGNAFVARLHYTEDGIYLPGELDWLRDSRED